MNHSQTIEQKDAQPISSPASSGDVAEKPASEIEEDTQIPPPDGGLAAWSVVGGGEYLC